MLARVARSLAPKRFVSPVRLATATTLGNREFTMSAQQTADDLIAAPVAVFSKSYCPYCNKVKALLAKHKISYKAIELDQVEGGAEIQNYLLSKTGQSTVPNVFVNGTHVGGNDDTHAAVKSGKLKSLLEAGNISYASL